MEGGREGGGDDLLFERELAEIDVILGGSDQIHQLANLSLERSLHTTHTISLYPFVYRSTTPQKKPVRTSRKSSRMLTYEGSSRKCFLRR